jgi:putative tryptophan/tyrosine transport system substrate-binding protein
MIRRREFITLIAGGAVALPLTLRAQRPAIPKIGFLNGQSPATFAHLTAAFLDGVNDGGFVVGRNAAIEYRWAEGKYHLMPDMAADLVRQRVDVIVAGGGPQALSAAKAASTTIPIVFASGGDPVRRGLVASLNRPGANVTGVFQLTNELNPKRLGLLRELVPSAAVIAILLNPNNSSIQFQTKVIQDTANAIGQKIHILQASTDREFDTAFEAMAQFGTGALLVGADPFFNSQRAKLVALAARHAVPAMYEQREFAVAGGLASYGTKLTHAYRQVGMYTARVLKGEKPADLPVLQSDDFEFVINLKTAKAVGVPISRDLLLIANEVIE